MRICAYAVMPNHWHLLLWPECDGGHCQATPKLTPLGDTKTDPLLDTC